MDEPQELHEMGEAARRGLQRAGVHLMKAAIEIVAGIGAFLEEINSSSSHDEEPDEGPQRIELE